MCDSEEIEKEKTLLPFGIPPLIHRSTCGGGFAFDQRAGGNKILVIPFR